MNYEQQTHAASSYAHLPPSSHAYGHQHPPAHPHQHLSHGPPGQMQQLPSPMTYQGPIPSDMAGNGVPSAVPSQSQPTEMPAPVSRTDDMGRQYRLDVSQQPKRARMCGFGDKDRRPVTPPPCVRLVIIDTNTGKEVDCNNIDHSSFVLNVDLWSEDGQHEVNLVRSSTATPSISSTVPISYTALAENPPSSAYAPILPSHGAVRETGYGQSALGYPQQGMMSGYAMAQGYPGGGAYVSPNGYGPPQQYYPNFPDQMGPQGALGYRADYGNPMARINLAAGQPSGMFTRNLIGSLAASAFRLQDTNDHIGVWFILQDLSVRTEGNFRLRFSFVNVGIPGPQSKSSGNSSSVVNTGKAPILASCFSEAFTVYSAKKFPGVCESTPLSKCFASQGIKIPIRKEGGGGTKGGDDDYDD